MAPVKRKSTEGGGRKSSSKAAKSGTPDLPAVTPQELEVGHMQIFQKWLSPVSKLLSSCRHSLQGLGVGHIQILATFEMWRFNFLIS